MNGKADVPITEAYRDTNKFKLTKDGRYEPKQSSIEIHAGAPGQNTKTYKKIYEKPLDLAFQLNKFVKDNPGAELNHAVQDLKISDGKGIEVVYSIEYGGGSQLADAIV